MDLSGIENRQIQEMTAPRISKTPKSSKNGPQEFK